MSEGGLHEPFEALPEQRRAEEAGIWIFLASEVIFFGGLFLGYAIYRSRYTAGFVEGAAETNLLLGVLNTTILLASTATMGLAVWSGRAGRKRPTVWGLGLTLALGTAFLAVKGVEYAEDVHRGLLPGSDAFPLEERGADLFFSFYWAMTTLHALHMVIGLGMIAWAAWAVARDRIAWRETAIVHVLGLYWNLVDVMWIFIFPLLYLAGRG